MCILKATICKLPVWLGRCLGFARSPPAYSIALNVTINVLLTLLSDSVLAGVGAFAFSTIVITLFGEIIPQARFSRNALRMSARLIPLLRVYLVGLFPIAKPTAIILNWWLGPEGITFLRERDFRALITRHAGAAAADVGHPA
jgi:CBS domain containing-hemolysin-like protein